MGADEPRQVRKEATAVRFPVCRGQPGPHFSGSVVPLKVWGYKKRVPEHPVKEMYSNLQRVNAHLGNRHGSFFEGFTYGRVSKASASDVFRAATVFHMSTGCGNHF